MTKTGLATAEIKSREQIAKDQRASEAADRVNRANIAQKQREVDRAQIEANERASKRQLVGSIFNAAGNLVTGGLSSAAGYAGRMGAARIAAASKSIKNDSEWYKRYTQNMEVFTNIPTFTRLGDFVDRYGTGNYREAIPGIQVIEWAPSVGPQPEQTLANISRNPVNQILMRTKEQVLKLNSRSSVNWEAADLGLNLFCTREIIAYLSEVKRAIGVALLFSGENLYLGDALIRALGFDALDFRTHLAEYKQLYEIMRMRFNNAIVAPKNLSAYDRTSFLCDNIFCDVDSTGAMKQLYIYKHLRTYAYLDSVGNHTLHLGHNPALATYSRVETEITTMITAIVEHPDFIEMYADLRHAFGDNLFKFEAIPMDFTIGIWYSKEILNQFKNTRTLPVLVDDTNNLVSANGVYSCEYVHNNLFSLSNGYLYQGADLDATPAPVRPYCCATGTFPNTHLTTFLAECGAFSAQSDEIPYHISEEFNNSDGALVLTRNMTFFSDITHEQYSSSQENIFFRIESCGTEIFVRSLIYLYSENGTAGNRDLVEVATGSLICGASDIRSLYNQLKTLTINSKFDWMYTQFIATRQFNDRIEIAGEFNKYALIRKTTINKLHEICTMSELYLPDSTFGFKRL